MIEHRFAALREVRLHYVTCGRGPLVLLLHGFPEFWYSWRHQIPFLAERGYRVVAPDMRGYNLSEKPRAISAYRWSHLVADVVELIRSLGEEKAYVVGHDWGGAVAWLTAAHHPEVVERLVVLNCAHPARHAHHLKTNLRQLRRNWYLFFFQLPWLPERVLVRKIKAMLVGSAARREAFDAACLERFQEAIERPGAATATLNYYRAALREQLFLPAPIPPIQAPTTLIWGLQDRALGVEMTYGTQALIRAPFSVHYLPGVGHWVNQEAPDAVNRLLLEAITPASCV